MDLPINSNLYQSMGENIIQSINGQIIPFRYPTYFTITHDRANAYIGLNETNQCGIFNTTKQLILLNFSLDNKEDPVIQRYYNFDRSTKQETNILVKNIFNLCFGFANNGQELIESCNVLLRIIDYIKHYMDYYNNLNRENNIYAGFSSTAAYNIYRDLNNYKDKLQSGLYESYIITPTRVSNRDLDLLLVSILKEHIMKDGYDGYIYNEYIKPEPTIITSNEIILDIENTVVPTELCLFNGYEDVLLIEAPVRPCPTPVYQKKYLKYKKKYIELKKKLENKF